VPAWIVMPRTSPKVKVEAVRDYGAEIVFCEPNLKAREAGADRVMRETGATMVHPYDDRRIIAGQATAAMELLEDVPGLDLVMTPVGGGGLMSGTTLACHYFSPATRVKGAEPAGADDAFRSLAEGKILPSEHPQTICDGLLTSLGEETFPVIRDLSDGIVTVEDEATIEAMRLLMERMKLVTEPSAAVPLGAILSERIDVAGLRVGIILSGGNADLDHLPW
jgi:threonine dehydratase